MKRVIVNGALGKMGSEVIKAVSREPDMQVVAGVDPAISTMSRNSYEGLDFYSELEEAVNAANPDVVVDFTVPSAVMDNIRLCMDKGVRMVVGTTGITAEQVDALKAIVNRDDWAVLIAPNFAIGALLMMRFAQEAAKYFANVEIIEYHHRQKKDAPSGTAIKTAEMINQVLNGIQPDAPEHVEILAGARGAKSGGVHIHSLRLPGYVAHQEVIFSSPGQLLTIKHDSTHRESFMPGVILAIRKIDTLTGVIYGLEQLLW